MLRADQKGNWKSELWTLRNFEANEILLTPYSSQLKDTHLMASAHVAVGLPKAGRGAHPENGSLALDGRGKVLLAPAGATDSESHLGSLFWSVRRSTRASKANIVFDSVTLETTIKMSLPAPKKRKVATASWTTSEMPTIPVLVNKAKILKHVQLVVFQPEKKKDKK